MLRTLLSAGLVLSAVPSAFAQSAMGPHVGAQDYVAARGEPFGPAGRILFEVTRGPAPDSYDARRTSAGGADDLPDPENGETVERTVMVGADWIQAQTETGSTLYDFSARRVVRIDEAEGEMVNSSLFAEAKRGADIVAALSEAGSRGTVEFEGVGEIDRFWLEAAMGVATEPAALDMRVSGETGWTLWRKGSDAVAAASFRGCGLDGLSAGQRDAALGWMNAALAIHPDILAELKTRDALPCALTFAVYSPDSPDGRIEVWRAMDVETIEDPDPLPADPGVALPGADALEGAHVDRALAAARGELGEAPGPADFGDMIVAELDAGNPAGALMLTLAETMHFGACPEEVVGSARTACGMSGEIARAGEDDPDYEQAAEGLQALREGSVRAAYQAFEDHLDRGDPAGAAARMIAVDALAVWGDEGRPDLDALELLEGALEADPFMPDAYARLGARYLNAGAPEPAFALFDLGRALPGAEPAGPLGRIGELETRLIGLAPGYFPFDEAAEDLAEGESD